jgi:hypothetical protein
VSTKTCKLMAEGLLDASSSSAFLRTILLRRILPDDFIPTRLLERLFGCVRDLPDYRPTTTQEATGLLVCVYEGDAAVARRELEFMILPTIMTMNAKPRIGRSKEWIPSEKNRFSQRFIEPEQVRIL